MTTHKAQAEWQGNLKDGRGNMKLGSGEFKGDFNAATRFEEGNGTNPEEMIGAAHAGCYSMALANLLAEAGHKPKNVSTRAAVNLDKTDNGFAITKIHLETEANIPNMKDDEFKKFAEKAKTECTVSKALGVDISLNATLKS